MIPIQVPPRVDLAEAHLAGKKLDNPCTTLITCIMLARQITLPQRQLLCFLLHPCKPSNFMQLRTLLRNGVLLSPLHSIISALFLSPRGWYPSASSALAGSVLLPVVGVNSGRPWPRSPAPASARSEEHTSEHQSRLHLVCRLMHEKKKKKKIVLFLLKRKKKEKKKCQKIEK